MQNITSTAELKDAIQQLTDKQAYEGKLLREQFNLTYASLQPVNLIKTFTQAVASPDIISNILSATIGLSAGFFSKRIIAGTSGNILKKVFGSMLLLGVTKLVARNPGILKTLGQRIFQGVFDKKQASS
jgi:hypothetical protein